LVVRRSPVAARRSPRPRETGGPLPCSTASVNVAIHVCSTLGGGHAPASLCAWPSSPPPPPSASPAQSQWCASRLSIRFLKHPPHAMPVRWRAARIAGERHAPCGRFAAWVAPSRRPCPPLALTSPVPERRAASKRPTRQGRITGSARRRLPRTTRDYAGGAAPQRAALASASRRLAVTESGRIRPWC
jgi:hypothetical protein